MSATETTPTTSPRAQDRKDQLTLDVANLKTTNLEFRSKLNEMDSHMTDRMSELSDGLSRIEHMLNLYVTQPLSDEDSDNKSAVKSLTSVSEEEDGQTAHPILVPRHDGFSQRLVTGQDDSPVSLLSNVDEDQLTAHKRRLSSQPGTARLLAIQEREELKRRRLFALQEKAERSIDDLD
jgi:hypothetical protein